LDAGARGIKLHPRAEAFSLDAPAAHDLAALADARGVPILLHAGRGIPALGRHTLSLAAAFPGARFILAHAAISDLAWLWRELDDHPNVFVDTAWWSPADLLALFALVPPGRILFASDAPYGSTVQAALLVFRCGLQAGVTPEQLREVGGRQAGRLVAGEAPLDLGPAPGVVAERFVLDPLLDRVATYLTTAIGRIVSERDDGAESLELARLACAVGEDSPHAALCAQTLELLDRYDAFVARAGERLRFSELGILTTALTLVRTPAVGLPELASEPRPVRSEIPA
ncbi:MAG: amidohydrolase family protein, partial [Actinomycetota bacterium]|nr:amidohydrolase family protein [Actinomycetota bacterium]